MIKLSAYAAPQSSIEPLLPVWKRAFDQFTCTNIASGIFSRINIVKSLRQNPTSQPAQTSNFERKIAAYHQDTLLLVISQVLILEAALAGG